MPRYKTHIVGGFCAYALLVALSWFVWQPTLLTLFEWFLCALAGSLFPDIDTKSKGQKYFYYTIGALAFVLIIASNYVLATYLLLLALIPLIIRHRGITHSVPVMTSMCVLLAVIASIQAPLYGAVVARALLFFWIGIISHIWLDLGFRRMFRVG